MQFEDRTAVAAYVVQHANFGVVDGRDRVCVGSTFESLLSESEQAGGGRAGA